MPNKWVEHVKAFSKKHNIAYGCAISNEQCKKEYKMKNPNEREMMGMEDFPAPEKRKPPPTRVKEAFQMAQEDIRSRKNKSVPISGTKIKYIIPIKTK